MKHFFATKSIAALAVLILLSAALHAQEKDEDTRDQYSFGRFHAGLYFGTLFAAGNTTSLYDGYGYNVNGERNNFGNSFMNQSINNFYGGNSVLTDQVAAALGVNHGDWSFDETDMPGNMSYSVAIAFGAHLRYNTDHRNSIAFNFTASKLSVTGDFTITLVNTSPVPQQPGYQSFKTFGITGSEQRFVFMLGWHHVFGDDEGFSFFAEGGAMCTLAKMLSNKIEINSLKIDLMSYYNNPFYEDFKKHHLSGIGYGAWGGIGMTTASTSKATLQFVYNPTLEVVALGGNTSPALHHYLGLRVYYNL